VVKCLLHLLKTPEKLLKERIEPVVSSALETRREHTTQVQVVVRMNRHLVLILTEVMDGVDCSGVAFEARHHKLLREAVRSDLLGERRVEDAQPTRLYPSGEVDWPSRLAFRLSPLCPRGGSLQDFAQPIVFEVLTVTWEK